MLNDYDDIIRALKSIGYDDEVRTVFKLRDTYIKQKAKLSVYYMQQPVVINIEGVEFKPKEAENATEES